MNERTIHIRQIKPKETKSKDTDDSMSLHHEKIMLEQELINARAELDHLKLEKAKMLQEVRSGIENEKKDWEQEKQLLKKEAHQEGYDLGYTEGQQKGERQYDHLIEHINELVQVATNDYHATIEQSESMIIDLAIKTAEKIVKEEIANDPQTFLHIVTAAIQEIKDQSVISIYLHPNNYESILKQKNELLHALDGDTKLSIYIDQKLVENECFIEHPFGRIDASIDTQLQQIHDVLHQVTLEKKS